MKSFVSFLSALLLTSLALGQSVPNGGTITQGQVWTAPQWTTAWQSKADALNGVLTSPSMIGAVTINGLSPVTYPLTAISSGFFYQNSGANIQRFNDRVFIGDATANDGQGPTNPVSADWLTLWQQSIGIPFGSVTSSQSAILTTAAAAAVTSPVGLTVGARTFNTTQNAQNAVGIQSIAVNNSPTFGNAVYAFYGEAHRANNSVSAALGLELDTTQRGALVGITPYSQNFGQTVALQLASGAQQGVLATASFATNVMTISLVNAPADNGLILVGYRVSGVGIPANTTIVSFGTGAGGTGTYNLSTSPGTLTSRIVAVSPMFDNTAAINIQANPNSYTTGINFGYNSIAGTDGTNGAPVPAIQFAKNQGMVWFSGASTGTGGIINTAAVTAGSQDILMGQGSLQIQETSTGAVQFQVAVTPSTVDYLNVIASTTGNPVTLAANGTDSNININLVPQGTGKVQINGASLNPVLAGTTGSIGGGALTVGTCTSGTATVASSTTGMAVAASPVSYPGDGIYWVAYVSGAGTVTVKVCATASLTPSASAYNVRVLQ